MMEPGAAGERSPTSIMFRFFPTILEEYRDIRTAMQMRGLSGLRNPIALLEYRFV